MYLASLSFSSRYLLRELLCWKQDNPPWRLTLGIACTMGEEAAVAVELG